MDVHTLRPSRLLRLLLLTSTLSFGCSALINPDETRLGDAPDAGEIMDGAFDDGGTPDADVRDAVVPRPDSGPIDDSGPDDAGPADGGPGCSLGCDDDIACTEDACIGDTCTHSPDSALCGAGLRCAAGMGCVAEECVNNSDCNDGVACTNDTCVDGACLATTVHARCDDDIDCTMDRCAPGPGADARGCARTANDALCVDDFCTIGATCSLDVGCTGGADRDCRDGDVCTADACNPDAAACTHVPRDDDGDGAPAESFGGTMCSGGTDCDDGNASIAPGVTELCDGFDNNCNGVTDEGCGTLPDTCATAEAIALSGDGTGRASGTFAALGNDYVTGVLCGASTTNGRDAVYYVDLPRGTWDLTVDTVGATADTVLGIGAECSEAGLGLICNNDMDPGRTTASRIFTHNVQVGGGGERFYILVEGDGSGALGDYVVNVRLESAHPDNCGSPIGGRALDITGGGTVLGYQRGFVGGDRGDCMPGGDFDEESVLAFESSSTSPRLDVLSSDFVPDLFVRAGCAGDSEVACAIGSGVGGGVSLASVSPTVTAATQHFAFVDGRGSYVLVYVP